MDLDAVEPGVDRVPGGPDIIAQDAADVGFGSGARLLIGLVALIGMGEIRSGGRRGGDGLAAAEVGMDHAAHVPQLGDNPSPFPMDRPGHGLPAVDLALVPQTWRVRPATALAADAGRL